MPALPYLSVLELKGADARIFLHNQLSADISSLAAGEATFACLCQPKGRVIALLLVQATRDGALVVCAKTLADTIARRLAMYVLRDDVSIRDRTGLHVYGCDTDECDALLRPLSKLAYCLAEDSTENGHLAWKERELAHGVVWLGIETSEQFLPQMLDFEGIGALSFSKGCFPGQEVIARTRYLGKLKRHALRVTTPMLLEPDALEPVTVHGEGQQAPGVVVDHAPLGDAGTRLFLVIRAIEPFPAISLEWRGQMLSVAST